MVTPRERMRIFERLSHEIQMLNAHVRQAVVESGVIVDLALIDDSGVPVLLVECDRPVAELDPRPLAERIADGMYPDQTPIPRPQITDTVRAGD